MKADEIDWTSRTERARQLAHKYPSAAEALVFYADLSEFQEHLLRNMSTRRFAASPPKERVPRSFVETLDQPRYRALVPKLLSWLQRSAPPPLASSAQRLLDDDPRDRQRMFELYWAWAVGTGTMEDDTKGFVVEAVLQPFAEALARDSEGPVDSTGPSAGVAQDERDAEVETGEVASLVSRCPMCGGRAVVGLLREAGHGARRALVCGLCSTEWRVPRIVCPACGEGRFEALSTIRAADAFPNVQVDACLTCKSYVKTLDLTGNNTMIAIVDDLASLALDLWAREQGFKRVRPNLLRL